MNIAGIAFLVIAMSSSMTPYGQHAKRSAPKEVEPVVYEGIKYTAPHWVTVNGKRMAGGFVEAFDARTKKKLRTIKVYEIKRDPKLEKDVQDVFITSLAIEKDVLVVVNERDERFEVDLKSHKVIRK